MSDCRIISDDGWYIEAPSFEEARATVIDMLVDTVGDIDEDEALSLFEHDLQRGIVHILHPTKGTTNVH